MPYLNKSTPDPEPLDCKILTAALTLFVEQGYHKVSIHEIQKLANVSIGSIYRYFNGKEGIAESLYHHILGEIEQLVDDVIINNVSARDKCEALIAAFFKHTETHSDIIAYVFHAKHSEFLPQLPSICNAAPFTKMQMIVQDGMDQGEFKVNNSWVAATTIFGGMSRLIQLRLDGVITDPLPEYTEQVYETIWSGVANTADTQSTSKAILEKVLAS